MITTKNEPWGFYGTLATRGVDRVAERFDDAARALMARFDLSETEARDFLDAPIGRHMADDLSDQETGRDLVARWLGDRRYARWLREAAGRVKARS